MNFKNDSRKWEAYSLNMPFVKQCITHSDLEYIQRFDKDSYDLWTDDNPDNDTCDKLNKKRSSMQTWITKEKELRAEILLLSGGFRENPGRKMSLNTFWSVLDDVTTDITPTYDCRNEEPTEESILAGVVAPFGSTEPSVITIPSNDEEDDMVDLYDSDDDESEREPTRQDMDISGSEDLGEITIQVGGGRGEEN